MTQVAPYQSTSGDTDFASVLAEQTLGQNVVRGIRKPPQSEKPSDLKQDLLENDFATISYEQALRTHARSTPAWSQHPAGLFDSHRPATDEAITSASTGLSPIRIHEITPKAGLGERRSASITIRLSKGECEQIHMRADQAGLTISAYLRSCVLEAEDLRAQVKNMIAELKSAQPATSEEQASAQPKCQQSRWQSFWAHFFRPRHAAAA